MKQLIIGYGEIGKAISAVVGEAYIEDKQLKIENKWAEHILIDVMHICFPYSKDFVDQVQQYIKKFKPNHIIIYSTVPIGTTKKIKRAVHSPIEGKHPDLELSIRLMERWIGANDTQEGFFFVTFFEYLNLRTKNVPNSDFTEALKLLSTAEYGINIEFARYKKHVADDIGMDYELTKQWNMCYNKLYYNLGLDKRFQKFVLDAPEGPKQGHCITPNALLLDKQYPNDMVKIVGEIL